MALSTYMVEVKYDIKAFNEHVTSQMAQLDASGEQSTNLIECLWQAWWFRSSWLPKPMLLWFRVPSAMP
jgi:hypothetical protein